MASGVTACRDRESKWETSCREIIFNPLLISSPPPFSGEWIFFDGERTSVCMETESPRFNINGGCEFDRDVVKDVRPRPVCFSKTTAVT